MHSTVVSMRKVGAAFVLALATALIALAQQPPPGPAGKTAEQVYKNIQVLQGTPVDQFLPEMRLFGAALGVDCNFCHLEEDRAKDDKEAKQTARKMISMVRDINKNSFRGQLEVTCYTCHRGDLEPVGIPILPTVERPELDEEQKPPVLPSADEILSKYIQALGGEQALRKVTSRMITATQDLPTGPGGRTPVQARVEQYAKAPNLQLNIYHSDKFTISDGFDGTTAWSQDAKGAVTDATGPDLIRAKRDVDFYESLNLKQEYSRLAVRPVEKVNNRDAYLVIGFPRGGGLPERFYFDVQTSLLLRRLTLLPTQLGNSPWQVDYDDYRDTGSGVKFPFVIRMIPGTSAAVLARPSTIRVEKVQDNAPIDGGKFANPQSKRTQAQ
jgi:photosynthetic reaction center cytochrome c subunit